MSAEFLRQYNTATHVYVPMIKRGVVDFAIGADWTPAAGDVKVSKDGGAAANIGTLPAAIAMGNTAYWDFTLANTEVTCKKCIVTVGDSATKAVEDQMFAVITYGNASAEFLVNFVDAVRFGLTALPNAAAEAAGGLYTRGSGAGQITQAANGQINGNLVTWLGTAPNALTSGRVDAQVGVGFTVTAVDAVWNALVSDYASNAGTTGQRLARFPNINAGSSGGVPTVDANNRVVGTQDAVIRTATAQAGAAGTITLDASASATDGFYVGAWVLIKSATGAGQARVVTAYVGATKVATIAPNWVTNPDNTSVFLVIPAAQITGVQGNITGTVATVQTDIAAVQTTANAINAKTTNLPAAPAAVGDIPTSNQNADALLDRAAAVDTYTIRQILRLFGASLLGQVAGAATTTITAKAADASKTRITATVDANGNRTAVVLDAT